jgi:hypothetical protein
MGDRGFARIARPATGDGHERKPDGKPMGDH